MTIHLDDRSRPRSIGREVVGLLAFVAASAAAGGVGSLLQGADVGGRYLALARPGWAPPQEAFGIVWPILYVLVGVAAWLVWRQAGSIAAARGALSLWAAQLVVNAAWPGVFFGLSWFWPAVAVIAVLDVLVVATMIRFARHSRPAAVLLVPYLAWLLYATALNVAIAAAN